MAFKASASSQAIHEPEFVQKLFNEMSLTYKRMNTITSLASRIAGVDNAFLNLTSNRVRWSSI